jgi:Subunit ChlI of Mg-chelatase
VLAAQGIFRAKELRRTVLLGELGLDGRVRPVRGILPATLAAQQAGFTRVIVPVRQAGEARLVEGIAGCWPMYNARLVTVSRWTLTVRPTCTPRVGPSARLVPSWAFIGARSGTSSSGLASPCVTVVLPLIPPPRSRSWSFVIKARRAAGSSARPHME